MDLPDSVDLFEESLKSLLHNCSDLIVKHANDDLNLIYFCDLVDASLVNNQLLKLPTANPARTILDGGTCSINPYWPDRPYL